MNNITRPQPEEEIPSQEALDKERYELLQRIEGWLETPMLILAFAWLALLVMELVWGESRVFEIIGREWRNK